MNRFFNKLIPDHLKQNAACHSSAKNIVGGCLIAAFAAPIYAFVYYYFDFPLAAGLILVEGLIIIATALSLRFIGSLLFARELIISSLFLTLCWLSFYLGGLKAPTSLWFILPPLLSIFFGGMKDGLFWGASCLAAILILFFLPEWQIPLPTSPITNELALEAISLGGLIIIIFGLAYLFDRVKKEASQELQKANAGLMLAKEEAERSAKNAEIANRLKTEFLANMSHELRTPLNAIIGFTELIYSGKSDPISAEHQEYLGDVLTSAHHLLQLINDILDLAKIESGKMLFHPELINLKTLTLEVKETLSALLNKKQLQFELEVDTSLTTVVLDPRKLKQVIYNYLSNAIKFTANGGRIKISIFRFGANHFKLEVSDSGIGIRKEDLERLFTKFVQLDGGSSKKYQGTGLGLALTQHIVEVQGGQVGVESEHGKGSTFFAVLPCTSPETIA